MRTWMLAAGIVMALGLTACTSAKVTPKSAVKLLPCPPKEVKKVCRVAPLDKVDKPRTAGEVSRAWDGVTKAAAAQGQSAVLCAKEVAAWRAAWSFCVNKALESEK